MKDKPKVGDVVILKRMCHRYPQHNKTGSATVEKVGTKYFEVSQFPKSFEIETEVPGCWYSAISVEYTCYRDESAVKAKEQFDADKAEKESIAERLKNLFQYTWHFKNLTLDQLRRIEAITQEKPIE